MSDLHVQTFGRFAIVDKAGQDLTPRSRKACALIANLLDAPDLTRPRAKLQDLLWSDRAPAQGAASLRQCLFEIRNALGPYRAALESDSRSVRLRPDTVTSDLTDPVERARAMREGRQFLEDVDVRDPEFEAWVRDWRLAHEETAQAVAFGVAELPPAPDGPPRLVMAQGGGTGLFAGHVAESIAEGVSNFGSVKLHWNGLKPEQQPGRAYQIQSEEHVMSDGAILRLRLVDLADGRICWTVAETVSARQTAEAGIALDRLINYGIDRTLAELSSSGGGAGDAFFSPVQQMLASRGADSEAISRRLNAAFEREGRGIYLAWKAFLVVYGIGERRVHDPVTVREETRDTLRRAVELEPHNPMVLALASHVYSFVLHEYRIAHSLAERSVKLDSRNVFGWLFLGSAKTYLNQLEDGYHCFQRARRIAGEGPYRHFVDFFAGMSASITGRFEEALAILELNREMTPGFLPPLRYLLATYLRTGDMDAAATAIETLKQLEPGFDIQRFAEPDYPVRKVGLIDAKTLKKLE